MERYYRAADALAVLSEARRLAILDVLSRRGPLLLGEAIFEAGCPTGGALRDAALMERAGLLAVERPSGRNLSCVLTITPSGRRALEFAGTWADV
jgi:predicted transcriptional regulator